MDSQIHRRHFLAGAIGTAAAGMLTFPSGRAAWSHRTDDHLNVALVGDMYVAGHFNSALHIYPNVDIVALCNADQRKIPQTLDLWRERARDWANSTDESERNAAQQYRRLSENTRTFADFRRMLEDMDEQIDAVIISTFDHLHGPIASSAMRRGKHVFCERPLGLTVHESRTLRRLAQDHQVATSIRNPGNASGPFRRAVELIREGVIGPVEQVHVWFDRGGPDHQQPPQGGHEVPEGLHWDLWLGPAAWRDYHPAWMAYAHWREFSNGGLGTFGPHAANLAFMALQVQDLWQAEASQSAREPIRVEADCSGINRLSFPSWEIIRWQVPARGELPPVTFTWHHGRDHAPGTRRLLQGLMRDRGASPEDVEQLFRYAGALIVGSEGTIVSDDHNAGFHMLPEEKFADVEQDRPQSLSQSQGHYHDWLIACRGGEPAWAHFDYAAPLSEFLMLGNVATQFAGEALHYDPVAGKILDHAEANRALSYEYRKGWTL